MEQYTKLYKISTENLNLRKQFLRFTTEDVHILKRLAGWAEHVADAIAKEFYDHQFGFSETRAGVVQSVATTGAYPRGV